MGTAAPDALLAALRAQHARRRGLLDDGARHVGWKIGGRIAEIEAVTGGNPAIGYLTSATVVEDGAALDTVSGRRLGSRGSRAGAGAGAGPGTVCGRRRGAGTGRGWQGAAAGRPCGVGGVASELGCGAGPPWEMEAIVGAKVFHPAGVRGRARCG